MFNLLILFSFLMLLLAFSHMAERARRQATASQAVLVIVVYGSVVLLQFILFLLGIVFQLAGRVQRAGGLEAFDAFAAGLGIDASTINWNLIGAGVWLPALIGLLVLLPPVRRGLSRLIPIEPPNHVHAIALSLATLAIPNLTVALGVGLDNLSNALAAAPDPTNLIATVWVQNLGFVLLALVGVGLFVQRDFGAAVDRLKIKPLTLRELGISVAVGIALLLLLGLSLNVADALGWGSPEVDSLSEELYGPIMRSLPGLLAVAVAAPIGEEALFRGAAQPRFGRVLTALLFTIVHGNYGVSVVTLGLFVVGYVLGVMRDRYSTTSAMVVHGTFNGIQALLAYVAVQYGLGV